MFNLSLVEELTGLTREEILNILKNYSELKAKFI